jgi:hypothetical protein
MKCIDYLNECKNGIVEKPKEDVKIVKIEIDEQILVNVVKL